MEEKRAHQRIGCIEKCLLYYENNKYNGTVTNISLGGVLVKLYGCSPGTLVAGRDCNLILSNDPTTSFFRYKTRIIRVKSSGVGLRILEHVSS